MKIAILADIHGNLPALERVIDHLEQWRPDAVALAGDVVNRGPHSLACLDIVQEKERTAGWQIVAGNHEDYVLVHTQPDAPRRGPEFDIMASSHWVYRQLNGHIPYLADLPFQVSIPGPDGREVRVVHASMRHNRDGIYAALSDAALRKKIAPTGDKPVGPAPAVLAVGHTHRPLVRRIDETLVVNVGSVGMPFDDDPRASYAQLTFRKGRWEAEIIRLAFDRVRAERDFQTTGFLPGGGPLTRLMLLEFRLSQPHMHLWMPRYQPLVLAGQLSVSEGVEDYLVRLNGRVPPEALDL